MAFNFMILTMNNTQSHCATTPIFSHRHPVGPSDDMTLHLRNRQHVSATHIRSRHSPPTTFRPLLTKDSDYTRRTSSLYLQWTRDLATRTRRLPISGRRTATALEERDKASNLFILTIVGRVSRQVYTGQAGLISQGNIQRIRICKTRLILWPIPADDSKRAWYQSNVVALTWAYPAKMQDGMSSELMSWFQSDPRDLRDQSCVPLRPSKSETTFKTRGGLSEKGRFDQFISLIFAFFTRQVYRDRHSRLMFKKLGPT
ncbi:hypothetical protein PGTUg99_032408 [Puccinia graminis f. sp. tritici]|uniref:Uncharacterized protein n=1 Tax=Puccinia graminis f. sp. tritici TaxID=56615 RepID=A0A5B0PPE7_PUCGR|nr:hypothetical protein PGTUg99_032408 [Puccinia graminis f. sp. tritici]